MARLAPEFRHDIFVSYSHGDVKGDGTSLLKTWSQGFARELEAELRTTPGFQQVAVFLDESRRPEQGLAAADPLTAQLRDAAADAAFLLLLMSPHYLESAWCRDERGWWLEQAAKQVFPEIGSRVFVARIWPANGGWPGELCDERGNPPLGVWFHERPGDEVTTRPFSWHDPSGAGGDFRRALVELVGQIAVRIKKLDEALQRKRQAAADAARLADDRGQLIYVHARARDEERWQAACDELIGAGYGVFPAAPEADGTDPGRETAAESEIVRTLSACDGLLLVPGDDTLSLVSDLAVVGHQRRNSARAIRHKPLPCAVIDRGLALAEMPLLRRSARNLRIDWIDAGPAGWTEQVRGWLGAAGAAAAP